MSCTLCTCSLVVFSWSERPADVPGHYGDHTRPRVADKGNALVTRGRLLAPDKEGVADEQCPGEGQLEYQTRADAAR